MRYHIAVIFISLLAAGCYKAKTAGSSSAGSTGSSSGPTASSVSASATGSSGTQGTSSGTTASGSTGSAGSTGSSGSSGGSTGSMCTLTNATMCTCIKDSDCPSPDYLCSFMTGLCYFSCATNSDCTGPDAPPATSMMCMSNPAGCACVINSATQLTECILQSCASDSDCAAGQQCVNGSCASPPDAGSVTACSISPAFQTLEVGQTVAFAAQAYAQGAPVRVALTAWSWSSSNGAVAVTGTGAAATALGVAPSGGLVSAVTAAVGTVTCSAQVQVFPGPDAGSGLRVIAVDELSGLPVVAAVVKVEGASTTHLTDTNGEADFSTADLGSATAPYTVSVFSDPFSYVTVVGTQSTDLAIPLLRNPLDVQGGFTGTVKDLFTGGPVEGEVALVGASVPGPLTDTTFDLISGPTIEVMASAFGMNLNFPAQGGELLGLGSQQFKPTFEVTGEPGTCPDAGESEAGSCGTRTVWTIGGSVSINSIPLMTLPASGFNLFDIGILSQLQPELGGFTSSLLRNEPFTLGPSDDGGVVDSAYLATLTGLDLASPPAVGMTLQTTVKVPAFPVIDGGAVQGAAVVAGVDVPGEGFVPLGLSAATATNGSVSDANGVAGQMTLNMAPAHNGVESGAYRIQLIATEATTFTSGSSASVLVIRPSACAMGSTQGLCFGGTVASSAAFLPLAQSASFNSSSRTFSSAPIAKADLLRVIFRDASGRQWRVYSPSSAGTFAVPSLPPDPAGGTFEDRTAATVPDGGVAPGFEVDALTTGVAFDQLVGFSSQATGATTLSNLGSLVTAFSVQQYP